MKTNLRKIYYVSGLISAIIIPLVFWYLGSAKLKEPIPNVLDLGLPAKYKWTIPMDKQSSFEGMRNYNYKKIIVNPNTAKENSKFYVSELKKLNARNEKETGIEFVLNYKNSYGDLVSILNDLHIVEQDQYGLDLDKTGHLFAIVDFKDPHLKEMNNFFMCGTIDTVEYVRGSDYFKGFKKFQYQLSQLPINSYYLIFSFLIFLQISVLSLLRKFS